MSRQRFWAIVASGGLALLTACGAADDPCAGLERASQAEIARANQGEEVEREFTGPDGEDVECELDRGRWVVDS